MNHNPGKDPLRSQKKTPKTDPKSPMQMQLAPIQVSSIESVCGRLATAKQVCQARDQIEVCWLSGLTRGPSTHLSHLLLRDAAGNAPLAPRARSDLHLGV